MALDSLVESETTYRLKPTWQHLYAGPFGLLYLAVFVTWISWGFDEHYELGCIGCAAVGLLQVLCVLFGHWFVGVQAFMTCTSEPDARKATWVKVVPTPNNGWAELLPLKHSKLNDNSKLWFEFQKVVYAFNADRKQFETVVLDTRRPMRFYQSAQGFQTDEDLVNARYTLGDNKVEMVIPQFMDLFKERATAPFFVFQVFCVGLWCLEDMWYYSLFTLTMLAMFEATLVKQQLKNMSEIRNMGNKTYLIHCYRNRKWNRVKSDELVPGDIVSIGRSQEGQSIPCDLLLLRGPCIVDESMLTGESVPQMKEPIESVEGHRDFDNELDSRLHVISGGTNVVQHTPPGKNEPGMKSPDNGCICYVLRTGFNTNQGKLLRTIMFGVKRVTANNLETFAFILFLLIFAIAAAAYLWLKGSEDPTRSKYKLFLECTLILTSVIPPELPIELSLAVNNSLMALQKLGVFCTEPFRIPFAGKIDVCCFDKTGTLTTDNLVVEGIALGDGAEDSVEIVKAASENMEGVQVLACCHSLVRFDEELVGDPLEKACLQWIDFSLTKSDTVIPNSNRKDILPLRIAHRFHFSSAMKRMTVIAGYIPQGTNEPKYLVAVKGAPEVLKDMYASIPTDYEQTYTKLTRQGARVLALGLRHVGGLTPQEIRDSKRDNWEKGLTFAGFVVISCPLKPDTKAMIKEIIDSSHRVVMITGDNPLTACHVAKVLRFTSKKKPTLILDAPHETGGYWGWKSVDGEIECEVEPNSLERKAFFNDHEFCITGSALSYLIADHNAFYLQVLTHIAVFARMAPKQKERVINDLKHLGKTTLMCGDGTNDVGALKHANVGVALLSHPYDAVKAAKEKEEREKKSASPEKSTEKDNKKAVGLPSHAGRRTDAPVGARQRPSGGQATFQKKLDEMMKEIEEEEKAQVYAPASSRDDMEYSDFLDELEDAYNAPVSGSHRYRFVHKIIMGDLNAKVGSRDIGERSVGAFGYGDRNVKGQLVVDLCERWNLKVGNTFFRKRPIRKYTWVSPNGKTANEIDYILFPRGMCVGDVGVVNQFDFTTDHRLVRASISFPYRFPRRREPTGRGDSHLQNDLFRLSLRLELQRRGANPGYGNIVTAIREAGKIASTVTPMNSGISKETKDLVARRRDFSMNSSGITRLQWLLLNRSIRQSYKHDRERSYLNYVNQAIANGKSYKKATEKLAVGKGRIHKIRNGYGELEFTQTGIEGAFQNFYNKLYEGDGGSSYRSERVRDPFLPISVAEVDQVLRHFKSGKAPGKDGVTGEMLMAGTDYLAPLLTGVFNSILQGGTMPEGFGDSRTILLPKTGDSSLPKNYRPISLLPALQKALTGLLNKRLAPILDGNRSWEQMGFRQGHSTVDAIHTLKTVVANCVDHRLPIYLLFVDISKAFDSVYTAALYRALEMEGVPSEIVSFLGSLSRESKNVVVVNGKEVEIRVGRGVRQGDCLSPRLFTTVLDMAFRKLDWSGKGININGRFLSHLLFADDAVLISHDERQIQSMVRELEKELMKVGLHLNGDKTVGMTSKENPREVIVAGKTVGLKSSVVYLGSAITVDGKSDREITRRIQAAYGSFHKHRSFLVNRSIPMAHKRRLFNGCILPAFLYASETWALTKAQMDKISVAQRRMERWMAGFTVFDHISNERLRDITQVEDVVRSSLKRKWLWVHKLANDNDLKWSRAIIDWIPRGPKRGRGRPQSRWKDLFTRTVGPTFLRQARSQEWPAMHIRAYS